MRNRTPSGGKVTGKPATDMNEDEFRRQLRSFGVSKEVTEMLLLDNEPYLLIAVIKWVKGLDAEFKNVRVIRGITHIVEGRDHKVNVAYLEHNSSIPTLPPVIIEMAKIKEFFALAQIIIECECGECRLGLPSD